MLRIIFATLLIAYGCASVRPEKPVSIPVVNEVYSLPWYSGYLDIGDMHMHYFFFPSQLKPKDDPVLFWFNGGPGCSSLLGALYEHGPFLLNDAFGSYMKNQYAWNLQANVVYIESPAEVGFSYRDSPSSTWNDEIVAQLNRKSVLQFFNVWNEYRGNPTFLAGESYAGIYVPTLFNQLLPYSTIYSKDPNYINLKGFAVGNGCTDKLECQFKNEYPKFLIQLYRDLGFINETLYNQARSECQQAGVILPKQCVEVLERIDKMQEGINIYDAFRPCFENEVTSPKELRRLALRKRNKPSDKLTWAPPCVDAYGIDGILNDPNNRQTLGVRKDIKYSMCNADDSFSYNRSMNGSYWVYEKIVPMNRFNIIIYSGDSDPAVPFAGTNYWINKLKVQLQLPTVEYWRPWFTESQNGKQNSGNVWTLSSKLKVVTFKGIGHMAPQWNYAGGFKMISNLLHGTEI